MSKARPSIGTDGRALPVLPPDRDARVWARLVRVMLYTPGLPRPAPPQDRRADELRHHRRAPDARERRRDRRRPVHRHAVRRPGRRSPRPASAPGAERSCWSCWRRCPFLCAVPALFHELAHSTLLHARALASVDVALGASELLARDGDPAVHDLPARRLRHPALRRAQDRRTGSSTSCILALDRRRLRRQSAGATTSSREGSSDVLVVGDGRDGALRHPQAASACRRTTRCAARPRRRSRSTSEHWRTRVWWISYRGEGKAGVDNIGVFEDDGTPRKKHPLLLDPSPRRAPAAHRTRLRARRGRPLHRQRLAPGQPRRALPPPRRHVPLRRHGGDDQARFRDGPSLRRGAGRRRPPLRLVPGHEHGRRDPAEDAQARLPSRRTWQETFPKGNFLPGTLVASSRGQPARGAATARSCNVPAPQGLKVVLDDARQAPALGARDHRAPQAPLRRGRGGRRVKVFEVASGRLVARIRAQQAHEARAPHPARRHPLHRRRRHGQHPRLRHPRGGAAGQAQGPHGDRRQAQGAVGLRDRPRRRSLRRRAAQAARAALLPERQEEGDVHSTTSRTCRSSSSTFPIGPPGRRRNHPAADPGCRRAGRGFTFRLLLYG